MNEWDKVASQADEGLAADLGNFVRRYESGRIHAYLIAYEWQDDDGTDIPTNSVAWDRQHPMASLGLALHAREHIHGSWESVDPVT